MKLKPSYKFLILIMLIGLIFLGTSRKGVLDAQNNTYGGQLFRSIELISSVMSFRLPDTINLYDNNFTEKEDILFQSSLDNIVYTLGPKFSEIQQIEIFYSKNNDLSKAVENFYILMFQVKEKSEAIDEEVFYQISDIVNKYGRQLTETNYKSVEIIFEQSANVINNAIKEIQDLVKLND